VVSELRLIQHCAEFRPREDVSKIRKGTRGIYALLQEKREGEAIRYDVVYIGMSRSGIQGRLKSHLRSNKKANLWSHFSVYAVWPNITDAEISELEGLFRAIYRKDSAANRIAVQKGFKKLRSVRDNKFNWQIPIYRTGLPARRRIK
jgi:hypothetical protein